MAAFSVATGTALLYDEGFLPPNPSRQALALASSADQSKLGSEGLAFRTTATELAMEDQSADGTAELSPTAMQFLLQNLAAPDVTTTSPAGEAVPQPNTQAYASQSFGSDSASFPAAPASLPVPGIGSSINVLA